MEHRKSTFLLSVISFLSWQAWAKLEVNMEDRVEVYRGDLAEIRCMFTRSEQGNVIIQWFVRPAGSNSIRQRIYYRDDVGELVDEDTEFSGRVSVELSQEGVTGNAILSIPDVRLSDEQEFICHVNVVGEDHGEGRTRLRVFESPELPIIESVHSGISVSNYKPSKIASCEVRDGYPIPNITWYRDRTLLHQSEEDVDIETRVTQGSSRLFSVESELYLTVVKSDKDSFFYCEVTYYVPGAVKMVESQRINITVYYPATQVRIWKESPSGLVMEGDRVELRCQSDANPQPPLTFTHNGDDITAEQGVLVLENVRRGNGGKYECSSLDLDSYAEMINSTELEVHFLDAARVDSNTAVLTQGNNANLTCNALSSLGTQAVWSKDGEEVWRGHVLPLTNATYDMAGEYLCEVTVPLLPGLHNQGSVTLAVDGIPEMTGPIVRDSVNRADRSMNLTCHVRGRPIPFINWTLSDPQSLIDVYDEAGENGILSTVTVKAVSDVIVSCSATNKYGRATTTSQISAVPPLSTSAAPSTVGGSSGVIIAVIIICILLLAILGSVLYFLYKKGKIPCGRSGKQDLTKENASKDDIVMEMKTDKSEETVLLQGVNGNKKPPNDL